jgi:hypothetical protein
MLPPSGRCDIIDKKLPEGSLKILWAKGKISIIILYQVMSFRLVFTKNPRTPEQVCEIWWWGVLSSHLLSKI